MLQAKAKMHGVNLRLEFKQFKPTIPNYKAFPVHTARILLLITCCFADIKDIKVLIH